MVEVASWPAGCGSANTETRPNGHMENGHVGCHPTIRNARILEFWVRVRDRVRVRSGSKELS